MANANAHFFLYAKKWYKRTDITKDLIRILSKYCGTEEKHLTRTDVARKMLELTDYQINHCGNPHGKFLEFVQKMNPLNAKYIGLKDDDDYELRLIGACLSILEHTPVYEIENGLEDKPDYFTILPKYEKPYHGMFKPIEEN